MPLTPDRTYKANGLTIYEYLLTKHNPNKIDMPSGNRKKTVAITIHNTNDISVAINTTPAEQYIRATCNNAMKDVRVHYYVDTTCAWQCLPDDYVNWSCADGCTNPNSGNNTSVAIEVIGNSEKAEANAVKLAAYLLNKYNLTVDSGLRTHTYWLNVKDGKTGTIDYLNTANNSYKNCPIYILSHWATFKANVASALSALKNTSNNNTSNAGAAASTEMYRIRKTWSSAASQIGAYSSLENAKKAWKEGYTIYDSKGNAVYPTVSSSSATTTNSTKNTSAAATAEKINVTYRAYTTKWNSEITNCNDTNSMGYAGIEKYPIKAYVAKVSKGTLRYRAHIVGGGWLGWITAYNINDWYHGYSGIKTANIDAIQAQLIDVNGYEVQYRVSQTGSTNYYDWVTGLNDYAGVYGKPIDKIQMKIVKK